MPRNLIRGQSLIPQAGYVWKYYIDRYPGQDGIFFRVTLSQLANQESFPKEFFIERKLSEEVDLNAGDKKPWSVTSSSISIAIIATIKEAFSTGSKVEIMYAGTLAVSPPGERVSSGAATTTPPTPKAIESVTILKA
jgi:hypothetical protein